MTAFRWALLVTLTLAALVVASLTAEPGDWRDAVEWSRARGALAAAEVPACPPLAGDPVVGDARAAYRDAIERAAAIPGALLAEVADPLRAFADPAASPRPEGDPLALVARLPAASLQALRDAARTTGALFSAEAMGDGEEGWLIHGLLPVVDGLLVAARHAAHEQERVDAFCDALAVGVDLSSSELPIVEITGLLSIGRAIAAADGGWIGQLSAASARRLVDVLATADRCLPPRHRLDLDAAGLVLLLDRHDDFEPQELGFRSRWSTWQHGFSVWNAAADRVSTTQRWVREFLADEPDGEAWPARRARLERLVDDEKRSNRDLQYGYLQHALEWEEMRREDLARLRLLRLALLHRIGEPPPDGGFADPLGDGLLTVELGADGAARFASAGPGVERSVPPRAR